jgi:hypothetical protein
MAELSYKKTLNEHLQFSQPAEFHELLTKGQQLLDAAHSEYVQPASYCNPYLQRFINTPEWTQSLWEIEKSDNTYPRDRLAVNIGRGALILSISYSDLQPTRSLTIGKKYAHISEQFPLRAQISHRELRREFPNEKGEGYIYNPEYTARQLDQFNDHLDTSIALMGLTYAIQREEVEELAA